MSDPFTAADLERLAAVGITEGEAQRQLALLRDPPAPVRLVRPATVGDGVLTLPDRQRLPLEIRWADVSSEGRTVKFVPASGAASRMFRDLEEVLHGDADTDRESLTARAEQGDATALRTLQLLDNLTRLAFYEDLDAALAEAGKDLQTLAAEGDLATLLEYLLTDADGDGLGYSAAPKGLVPFHRYPGDERRTAFEEHMIEAVGTVRDEEGVCRLHLTVAPAHQPAFMERLEEVQERYQERYECQFEVRFSPQLPATDTIAVDLEGNPFRTDDGKLLLRPGGHGALLPNLASLDAELAVIKNVDNVVPERRQEPVLHWQRLLIGTLAELRQRTFDLLSRLESTGGDDDDLLVDTAEHAALLGHPMPQEIAEADAGRRRSWSIVRLNRPLRVCGVVANEGEPGGGPFWVDDGDGGESLQIVERSQIDADDPEQEAILASATHFNPVQLVCALTDRDGDRYDLATYVDNKAVFIAEKSHQGRPLKALERPGLWNGAMAGWNTVFVEVPLATFAPVKTVFDLLRKAHQTGVPAAAKAAD